MRRRLLLRRLTVAMTALMLLPQRVVANWNQRAFDSTLPTDALKAAFGRSDTVRALEIELKMPTTAYQGALVPVMALTRLPGVTRMALLVHENPQPLVALFEFGPNALAEMATRVRLLESSEVTVVVESAGQLFSNSLPVRVLVSACDSDQARGSAS
jgi:sulfur-oxidizing protein SoxY